MCLRLYIIGVLFCTRSHFFIHSLTHLLHTPSSTHLPTRPHPSSTHSRHHSPDGLCPKARCVSVTCTASNKFWPHFCLNIRQNLRCGVCHTCLLGLLSVSDSCLRRAWATWSSRTRRTWNYWSLCHKNTFLVHARVQWSSCINPKKGNTSKWSHTHMQ